MTRTEIHLSEPFEEVLARLLTLPSTVTETDELRFLRAADSVLRKSAKCDAEVKEALRSLYEAAHGRQVETQIGFVTIAPPVAGFLKEAPYYVTTQYEFLLEAFTRVLAGTSPRKDANEWFLDVTRQIRHGSRAGPQNDQKRLLRRSSSRPTRSTPRRRNRNI